ncbi:uncharacterized protein V2V93DRAFT_372353 [Kockiozyma suomiensis]|uniref:uncharacterized protein n=1 Tax=Kockiozyma suomiensis TaxID=1337062 RepID=UPI003343C362
MSYLVCRSLFDHRHGSRRLRWRQRDESLLRPPRPQCRSVRLAEIDPERLLLDHVILGCSTAYPFKLVTLKPNKKRSKDSSEYDFLSGIPGSSDDSVSPLYDPFDDGGIYLWALGKRNLTINSTIPPQRHYPGLGDCTRVPLLCAFSAWSLPDNTLLQVIFRCEQVPSSDAYATNDTKPTKIRNTSDDRELLEFRIGSFECERVIMFAGTGEFVHREFEVCFDLFDKFGLLAVSMNSRLVIYHSNLRQRWSFGEITDIGKLGASKYWHAVPDLEVEYSSSASPHISIIELDFFIMDNYPRNFAFEANGLNIRQSVNFDQFAIKRLRAISTGYSVVFGALDTMCSIFVVCSLHLNAIEQTITVHRLYKSNVSKFRADSPDRFSVHHLLCLALKSRKFGVDDTRGRGQVHCNTKPLETYKSGMSSLQRIELFELDMILQS